MTLALNHFAPFLLTRLLRDRLVPAPRVISLNSRFHTRGRIDFDDLDGRRRYGALRAYASAKLANLLFMYELARRLPDAAVNAVYPGDVYTNAARNSGPIVRGIYRTIGPLLFISPEKGADTVVWAAADPAAAHHSGQLLYKRAPMESSPASRDEVLARRLWAETEARTGTTWD
jgi:NAD(P)-dependent dehydrogenase (short-subunit alcohol dehydrogenase family)